MKDYQKEELIGTRPKDSAEHCINFCLDALFEDKKHYFTQDVCKGLTFEELIGALLLAQDLVKEHKELLEEPYHE